MRLPGPSYHNLTAPITLPSPGVSSPPGPPPSTFPPLPPPSSPPRFRIPSSLTFPSAASSVWAPICPWHIQCHLVDWPVELQSTLRTGELHLYLSACLEPIP